MTHLEFHVISHPRRIVYTFNFDYTQNSFSFDICTTNLFFHAPREMSLHLELGFKEYAVLVLKLGPTSNAPSYISLAIPPSHVVALLAICQLMMILRVLLQALSRWRTGSSGSNAAISDAIVRGWSFVFEPMKRNLIKFFVELRDLIQSSIPKKEENGGYNAVSPHPCHPTK